MESANNNLKQEAHVLIFPSPVQGHINTMLRLAYALSFSSGLRISFLNTDHNHRLLRFSSPSQYSRFSLRSNFRFLSIPDGLPDGKPRSTLYLTELFDSLKTRSVDSFRALLLAGGNRDTDGWPPVTCVIVDGQMPYFMDAAQELGIPAILFRTINAYSLWVYLQIPQMMEADELPFPADADLDVPIKSVPAMEGFLRRRDLPKMCRGATKADNEKLQLLACNSASATPSKGLILNTSNSLEAPILSKIRSLYPNTYAIGPLHALVESITSSSVSASLLAEDRSALSWLDSLPDRSVVYVSFGSIALLMEEEFMEFWNGLVNSGHLFLWVVRPDLVANATVTVKLAELEERVRIVEWAPQEEVMRHRAVGCFITHSGWNSTVECMERGVPMVCFPWLWEQFVISRLVGEVWKVGLDMKDMCRRDVVESMVRAAMEGEKAEELRQVAAEMAVEIGRSVGEGGDSRLDYERLVRDILSLSLSASGE
ncbi:7-deoxyloganetic acid glucosyltransferase-like [Dendrobium catenatum]|uniref:7-deoxyloganetic acid glucosyltransferase-like n=1 Tax=Dendrobium catenatum TaxID=906689 RepID=UPI0009F6197B|nr:7-deoxyloganetic acid glucosyltransferase-like [Dendrobium catenatum]